MVQQPLNDGGLQQNDNSWCQASTVNPMLKTKSALAQHQGARRICVLVCK